MKLLSDYFGKELKMIQPKITKRIFELRSDEEVLATMQYPKMFSTNAVVEGPLTGNWEFYNPKFLSDGIEVRPLNNEMPVANFKGKVFSLKEVISLPQGEKIIFKSYSFKFKKELQDENGNILVVIRYRFSFKNIVFVDIVRKSETIDRNPWIILLALYIDNQRKKNTLFIHSS